MIVQIFAKQFEPGLFRSHGPERKSASLAFLRERGIQQRDEDCLLLISQDALRVTGWDTLNPNTVSVRAEEEEKKSEEYVMGHAKNTRDNIFGSRHKNRLSLSLEMYLVTG